MATTVKEAVNYPMISTSAWWALRKKFNQTMPPRVTANSLASLLDMTPRSVSINLLSPLRKMGLIDSEGKTTDRAKRWRDDDQYQFVCEEIRREIYPQELLDTFPGSDSPRASIEKWFAIEAGVGESVKQKMTTLYLLLAEADPTKQDNTPATVKASKTSKPVTPPKFSSSGTKKVDLDKSNGKAQLPPESEQKIQQSPQHDSNIAPSLHIDIQIHIPPEASAEQIDHIFASMAKHFYKGNNLNE
jgi:DNA-binding transcriptional ArsR family regulator